MTLAIAIGPLLLTPVILWLLMEYGPERSAIFAIYWLVLSIAFAIAMPWFRRRGRSPSKASALGAVVATVVTSLFFLTLLFGLSPRAGATSVGDPPPSVVSPNSDVPIR